MGFRRSSLRHISRTLLSSEDVASKKGLDAARPTGWRFLVRVGSGFVGIGESAEADGGSSSRLAKLDSASRAQSLARLLESVEHIVEAEDPSEDFELRYLRIPALVATSFWLHGPQSDLVVPIEIDGQDSDLPQLMNASEYFESLVTPALKRLEEDEKEIGG